MRVGYIVLRCQLNSVIKASGKHITGSWRWNVIDDIVVRIQRASAPAKVPVPFLSQGYNNQTPQLILQRASEQIHGSLVISVALICVVKDYADMAVVALSQYPQGTPNKGPFIVMEFFQKRDLAFLVLGAIDLGDGALRLLETLDITPEHLL